MTRNGSAGASRLGTWLLDLHTGAAWRDDAHDAAFGYERAEGAWCFDRFMSHVEASDHRTVYDRYVEAISSGQAWAFTCDIAMAGGAAGRIRAFGDFRHGDAGGPPRLEGFVEAIPTRDRMEHSLREALDRVRRIDGDLYVALTAAETVARRRAGEGRDRMLRHLTDVALSVGDDGAVRA